MKHNTAMITILSTTLIMVIAGLGAVITFLPDSLADRIEMVMPSVVHVENVGVCQGSGAIISSDGLIVTAKHVVEGGNSFVITLNNGSRYYTERVIEDELHDVAFLKIEAEAALPYIHLQNLEGARVGDNVFIAGSPFGFDNFNSVSTGIISYLQRNLDADWDYGYGWEITFQTDSAANPGNSGGPVFNLDGQCIGILVAGMSEGVNYAVPVSVFMDDLDVIHMMLRMQKYDDRMEREYYEEYYESTTIP